MSQTDTLYSVLLLLATVISISVAILLVGRRNVTGARSMVVLMLGVAWWSATYALHWTQVYRPYPYFWLDATYLGVVTVPTAFFIFALNFTHHNEWLTRRNYWLLAIVPCITLLSLYTDPWHRLFFGGKRTGDLILNGGPWYWVNLIYSYALILIGVYFLVQYARRSSGLYRRQAVTILVGISLPLVLNLLTVAGFNPFPLLDLTPITFTFTGVILAYGLLQQGILDIIPVARDALVESMADGMLVLDAQNRIVDINPAAQRLFETNDLTSPIGQQATALLAAWTDIVQHYLNIPETQEEIRVDGAEPGYYHLRITPLYNQQGHFSGRLVVLRDITERKKREMEIQHTNQQLRMRIAEIETLQAQLREMAIRDSLTGLFNRRYLEESLAGHLAHAERDGSTVGLLMLDIDLFKSFNDTYGHPAGDQVLRALGGLLRASTRSSDIACRYGGEEFIIVLLDASLADARHKAEYLRKQFETIRIPYSEFLFSVTVSIGVAVYPEHAAHSEALLIAADKALYAAKQAGRNRVMTWDEIE